MEINDLRTPLLPVVTSNRGRMVVTEPKPHNIDTVRLFLHLHLPHLYHF